MRISHSSSLILATLAISSSSSSLAAPTEHNSLEQSTYPSSSGLHSALMAARGDTYSMQVGGDRHDGTSQSIANIQMSTHERRQLESLLPLLGSIPVIGGPLSSLIDGILATLGLQEKGAAAVESLSSGLTADQTQKILALLGSVTQQIGNATGNAVNGVVGGNNRARSDAGDTLGSTSSSGSSTASNASYTSASSSFFMQPSATSVEAMGVPTPPTAPPSLPVAPPIGQNGTVPASPPLPVNPPNTPNTSNAPRPPIPAGVAPPSGPIPRDAPPLFYGIKAADVSATPSASSSASMEPCASVSSTMASASASCTSIMTASSSATMMSSSAAASSTSSST
ncbi:hypothetical protein GY45DRAFT_1334534 [Cubamyces sp. BRFM 1775]|nr:hypothetical protein GY45DRAFT_1334534 [Cubamyces sp. BRFM 1775]